MGIAAGTISGSDSLAHERSRGCPIVALQTADGAHDVSRFAGVGVLDDLGPVRVARVLHPQWETFFVGDFATE